MKKLSLLVAMALLITVSGVYATWTYTDAADDIWDVSREALVQLETATTDGAAGSYNIETNLRLYIDQITADDGKTEHKAKLVMKGQADEDPYLTVTFTPAHGATDEVKNNAIPTELYFKTSADIKFEFNAEGRYAPDDPSVEAKDIFVFSNLSDGLFNAKPGVTQDAIDAGLVDAGVGVYDVNKSVQWGSPNGDGVFTVTYEKDDLAEMIKLNCPEDKPFILDSKTEYDTFNSMLQGKTIIIGVTDGTVNTGSAG